jgi:pimeloyl-ACP methyl ester carboxylesterase
MGGGPEHRPERFAVADPLPMAPLDLPVLLVHGIHDRTVSIDLARRYARRASSRGGACELVEIDGEAGGHRALLDPRGEAWAAVTGRLGEPSAIA